MPMKRVRRNEAISRDEFHRRLRSWLAESREHQIGDEGVKGVTPWVHIRHEGRDYKAHADTKRHAIEWYLQELVVHGENIAWTVIENQRGKLNALAIGPERLRPEGFYLYSVD